NEKNRPEFKKKATKKCQKIVDSYDLSMKIIDTLLSFDGGRLTFAFTAPKRIDFRKAVKRLAGVFHKSIRMHQVGVRQVAKAMGGVGPCGRTVCCAEFLDDIKSVTTDAIKVQRLSHRGPERLTGLCGRLKCCLLYEKEAYEDLVKKFPPLGSKVKTAKGNGTVVDWRLLKGKIIIKKKNGKSEMGIEVDLKDIK
ncbi:MAG TPA: regulatory iron-sulfur-containing complex subunit RicT, partial [Patescibacteria group bacterium]|nr:regulatory iron-sulfur-containing complex subunit RicT [Patescibacteria group bacterium]